MYKKETKNACASILRSGRSPATSTEGAACLAYCPRPFAFVVRSHPPIPPLFSLNHNKDRVLEPSCCLAAFKGTMQDQHHHHHRARRPQAAAAALLLLVACLVQCLPTVHSFVGVGSRALWTLQHAGTPLRYDPFERAERGQNISLTGCCPSCPSPLPLSTHTTTTSQRHASAPQRARDATTCSAIASQTGQKSSKVKKGEILGVGPARKWRLGWRIAVKQYTLTQRHTRTPIREHESVLEGAERTD